MKVSIITVCFNSQQYIRTAVESVLSQKDVDIEYIVVDGGSSDGTLSILNEYSDFIARIISEPDAGIYDAINKGIALASGDVIGILNSDDFYPNNHIIADVVMYFDESNDIDMVLGNVDFVSGRDLNKSVRLYSSFNFSPWKLRFGFMPAHPATFIKISAYEKVGQYKLGYKIGADFDMFVRMLLVNKLSYKKMNKILVRMRTGGVSTSGFRSYRISTREILRSLNENHIYSNLIMVLIRLPVKIFQRVRPDMRSK